MPDRRTHRGAHPGDGKLFAPSRIPPLREALGDFCWLLEKGYADKSALKLVGDRFALTARQRLAVMRSACSDTRLRARLERRVEADGIAGRTLALDGYNVLITLESAMSGGALFVGRDGVMRDMASLHGTYRKVEETVPAIELVGRFLHEAGAARVSWLLDSPVSNSGRLKALVEELARGAGWPWAAELARDPDAVLSKASSIVASSDGPVLDRCGRWVNLVRAIVEKELEGAWIVDLSGGSE